MAAGHDVPVPLSLVISARRWPGRSLTVGLALSLLAGTSASPAGAGTVPPMAGPISRVPDVTSSARGLSLTLSVTPGRAAPGAAGGVHPDRGRPGRQWRPRLRGQVRGRVEPRQRHTDVLPGRAWSPRTRDVAVGAQVCPSGHLPRLCHRVRQLRARSRRRHPQRRNHLGTGSHQRGAYRQRGVAWDGLCAKSVINRPKRCQSNRTAPAPSR